MAFEAMQATRALEKELVDRARGELSGKVNPWDDPRWKPLAEGVRTNTEQTMDAIAKNLNQTGVTGPAAGLVLEKAKESGDNQVLNLANGLRSGQNQDITQGLTAGANRLNQAMQFYAQREMQDQAQQNWGEVAKSHFSNCCWIFIKGEMFNENVKNLRNQLFPHESFIAKGYRKMALWLIPLMHEHKWLVTLLQTIMLRPIRDFADNPKRRWLIPVCVFWCLIWHLYGACAYLTKTEVFSLQDYPLDKHPDQWNYTVRCHKRSHQACRSEA